MSVNTKEHLLTKEQKEALYKPFKITSVSRADLVDDGYDRDAVLALTDAQMVKLADSMAEAYVENGFWADLQSLADEAYKIKRAKSEEE